MTTYYTDYPKKKMPDPNPYYCCACCSVTDPQINGRLDRHREFCEYRAKMVIAGFKDD
jgi:hypothetical protein